MDVIGEGERSFSRIGSTKTLKKQKSLPRLFFSTSRKLSRSKTPSPSPDEIPEPTPRVPFQYLPPSPRPSELSETPSSTIDYGHHKGTQDGHIPNAFGLEELKEAESTPQDVRCFDKNTALDNYGQDASNPAMSFDVDSRMRPHTATTVRVPQVAKPAIHYSPTFPLLRKRSRGVLQMATAVPPSQRERGLSTSSHKLSHPPPETKPPYRPSTAGGDYTSNTDRSKRRHKEGNTTNDPDHEIMPPGNDNTSTYRPWQPLHNNEEVRSSFRSAVTTNSSYLDTTSTERSSVLTRDTSNSDLTVESPDRPVPIASWMTVDDAIDMYVMGFADDIDHERDESTPSSTSEERRRSVKIAEAINDSIGPGMLFPVRPPLSGSPNSFAIMSGEAFSDSPPKAPPILPPTSTRDQYGFLKASHHISVAQYDAWNVKYTPSQDRRTKKWSVFMRDQGLPVYLPTRFPDRSVKAQRYVRKGVPPAWRGAAWFHYAGGHAVLDKNPNLYSSLVARSYELNDNDKESIERDLHRTFPDNIHFKPDPISNNPTSHTLKEAPLLSSLRRVLQAFALYCPRIGYCQSLNFITGLLLLFLSEEKAFWMLHIITTTHLPGTHELSLEGANVDLWVLMIALKESMQGIWAKVGLGNDEEDKDAGIVHGARLPPISLCTTSWFMSLFIGTLPIESVLRVWDVLFYEGSKTLFRTALAVFKLGEQRIRDVSDSMEIFQVVQALPRGMLDVGGLMRVSCRRGGVSQEWVERKRRERRKWYARERASAAGVAFKDDDGRGLGGGGEDASVVPVRANSVWRRRAKLGKEAG